jgi:methylated-DNA-[protein]-cysteine S-methyltransferase
VILGDYRFEVWMSSVGVRRIALPSLEGDVTGLHELKTERVMTAGFREKGSLPDELAAFMESVFKGREPDSVPRVDLSGMRGFALEVLKKVMADIPWGRTRSYGWVARSIHRPGAARAVGGALSRNPIPLLVPCHRVVRADGGPVGYSSGKRWKMLLLKLESGSMESGCPLDSLGPVRRAGREVAVNWRYW